MAKRDRARTDPENKRSSDVLEVSRHPGEDFPAAVARTALRPTVRGGMTIKEYSSGRFGDVELMGLINELLVQGAAVEAGDLSRGEGMLVVQAHTLDAIFNTLAQRAINADYMDPMEKYLRLALKAQSQCRTTIEAIAGMKNPGSWQARPQPETIQAQQASGGVQSASKGESENLLNKLLEKNAHERLDHGDRKSVV